MGTKGKILVVDDEPDMLENLITILKRAGFESVPCSDGTEALACLHREHPDLVITDLKMRGLDGIELLDRLRTEHGGLPAIMITGYATIEAAVEAMKRGAADFLAKPFPPEELLLKVQRVLDVTRVLDENRYLRAEILGREGGVTLVGKSPAIQNVEALIHRIAGASSRVLITGESGTGKEVVARLIHAKSPRSGQCFYAVNCVALTETLLESELFGHERGAFTGAIGTKKGVFELADGGTLFLDEIGDTSPAFQGKLLRVVQDNEFRRVGGTRNIQTDVRIIASTNRDLEQAISEGRFRGDLFYRLAVVHVQLPPLRDRREDIPILAQHFLDRFGRKMGKRLEGIAAEALEPLTHSAWPGNIRELENVIERAVIMARGAVIQPEDLPVAFQDAAPREQVRAGTLEDLERELIERTLVESKWNKTEAARRMGIGRRTLYDKAARYGIPLGPEE
jgi:DNA-binding NtrC family response regulator